MKFLKTKACAVLATLTALLMACGSQVVEFPEDAPPASLAPDAGDEPCDDCQNPPDPEDDGGVDPGPEDDAGPGPEDDGGPGPDEDAGSPTDDGGLSTDGGSDAGQPPTDGGGLNDPTCNDKNQNCGQQYGCCVSSCAHKCHRDAVKTKKQCIAYQACFKVCQGQCKAAKAECECRDDRQKCKSKCDSEEKKCLSRATCEDDRWVCKKKASKCRQACEKN